MSDTPWVGREVAGRWRVVEEISRSAQAKVFSAESADGPATLWLARCPAEARDHVLAERTAWLRPEHAYLLRWQELAAWDDDGQAYLVLVTAPVQTCLRARLAHGRKLSPSDSSVVGTALSSALVYLHGAGTAHGAVCPEHLFWTGERWCLGGHGLAALFGEPTATEDVAGLGAVLLAALTAQTAAIPERLPPAWRALLQSCTGVPGVKPVSAEWVLRELTSPDSPLAQPAPAPVRPRVQPPSKPAEAAEAMRVFGRVMVTSAALVLLVILASVALTYPARRRRQDQGDCQSHLKQIALATMMYVQDWDERFPCPLSNQGTDVRPQLLPYMRNKAVFDCPAQRRAAQSYFYCAPEKLRLADIARPAELGLHGEGRALEQAVFPHNDGCNVAFADGHVKWTNRNLLRSGRWPMWHDTPPWPQPPARRGRPPGYRGR